MLYIESCSTDAAFHFAAEEFCMTRLAAEHDIFMLWQTDNCVMLGRNQVAQTEIDFEETKRLGAQIVRRSSGGGAIYTDGGAFLCTLITQYKAGQDAKKIGKIRLAEPLVRALARLGINAETQGRNDILLAGKKISGLAQYVWEKSLCSHCSLLYDADLAALEKILTPDVYKLNRKGVASVRSRVTNISGHMPVFYSAEKFKKKFKAVLLEQLSMREYSFSPEELRDIELLRKRKYANPEWTYKLDTDFTYHNKKRFPLGSIEIFAKIAGGIISSCSIYGDFLSLLPVEQLEDRLLGKPYRPPDVLEELNSIDLSLYLGGISAEELLSTIFNV